MLMERLECSFVGLDLVLSGLAAGFDKFGIICSYAAEVEVTAVFTTV
jgi:hypothetical protein